MKGCPVTSLRGIAEGLISIPKGVQLFFDHVRRDLIQRKFFPILRPLLQFLDHVSMVRFFDEV